MWNLATPESIAALATARGTTSMSLGSKGVGIMYSGPNSKLVPAYALYTSFGTGSLASIASASEAASNICWLISLVRVSSAALKRNGKHIKLFIWLGKSDLPVAIIASGLYLRASGGKISGSGFAMAKMIGLGAMTARCSPLIAPAAETPTMQSAPYIASTIVLALVCSLANSSFHLFIVIVLPL